MRIRRVLCLCMAAMTMICCLASCAKAPEANKPKAYQNFRDIPGVTAEEIAAIEALQAKCDTLTYGMMFTTETFERADGTVGGYSALFADWMSELFEIEFVPKIYLWEDLYVAFENGEIDFTGELTATPERRERFYMTDTFTERAIKAFRVEGSMDLSEIAKTRSLRYIFLEGTTTVDAIVSASQYPVEVILVPNEEAALGLLYAGKADAFMAEAHGAAYSPSDIVAEDIFPVVYSPISFSTSKEELSPIVTVLDKYLKNGALHQLIEMYNQGNREYDRYKFYASLTDEEKTYLAAHQADGQIVPVLIEYDAYPISVYNAQEKAWQGISVDVLDGIKEISGLNFQYVNATDDSWAEIYEKLEHGEGAMITELIRSPEREGNFLWTENPYTEDYFALISLLDYPDTSINEILFSKVGTVENSAYVDVFRSWFPDHQSFTSYLTSDDAFAALESGEIDLLMASKNLLLSATNYNENPGFKVNLVFARTFGSFFGFAKEEQILCNIVSKAQAFVDKQIITERWTSKSFDYRNKMATQQVFFLAIVIALLLFSLAVFFRLFMRNRQMNKRLEITVKERTAQFENAAQAKGDFLSRMSHEIRTPLNAVIGMARIARRSAEEESPKTVESIDQMLSASSHLLGILNDVLDMSKIEAGKFALYNEAFELLPSLREVKSIIGQRCSEKGILFETDYEDTIDTAVTGDQLRLKQVLINLLGNAVKFTEAGGKISLLVRLTENTGDRVSFNFTVRDSGIGMNEEQLSHLFTAFEQAGSDVANKYGGTGLGLAISQNLVMLMGGKINVQSKPNEGSEFTFTIVFDAAALPEHTHQELDIGLIDLSGKRILLAEDVEINRVIVLELLKDTQVVFTEASDGAEAVRLFSESEIGYYDMILMDVQMPIMNGYEATSAIRSLDRSDAKAVSIIAMTANAYSEDVNNALRAGMNAHLAKPIDIAKLMQLLYDVLCEHPNK